MNINYKVKIFLAVAFLSILLNYWLFSFVDNFIVVIVEKIDSVWYNDLLFIGVLLISFIYIFQTRKKVPSLLNYLYSSLFYLLFFNYRVLNTFWDFTLFSFSDTIAYLDIIHPIFLFHLIKLIFQNKSVKNQSEGRPFFIDEPIDNENNDLVNYNKYAKVIVEKILVTNTDRSFAIGINGKWGIGKTSFMNFLKTKISESEDDTIQVVFNPWNSNSSTGIVNDFFEILQNEVQRHYSQLSGLIYTYSDKLVKNNESDISKNAHSFISLLTGISTIETLQSDISDSLKKVNKKIIVYVDDLDRLNREEILEVFKLIRNTANFRNTFFIVAYDKGYIEQMIFLGDNNRRDNFMDKIFQLEITLPPFNRAIFLEKLADNMKAAFPEEYHEEISNAIFDILNRNGILNADSIENFRDVVRISNSISLNLKKLIGEVDIRDFLHLEILRTKQPSFYQLLYYHSNKFLKIDQSRGAFANCYSYSSNITGLKGKISELVNNCNLTEKDYMVIDSLLKTIFTPSQTSSFHRTAPLSVIYPSNFNRYFAFTLLEGELSELEFSKARKSDEENFKSKIDLWVSNGYELDLLRKFSVINNYDSKSDFEIVIKGIFYLANKESARHTNQYVWFSYSKLLEQMYHSENLLTLYRFEEQEDKLEYASFVRSLFTKSVSSYLFESSFIKHILENAEYSETSFILSKSELHSILLNYLIAYTEKNNKVSSEMWHFYRMCNLNFRRNYQSDYHEAKGERTDGTFELFNAASSIIKSFVLDNDLEGFLNSIIIEEQVKTGDKKLYKFDNITILDVFGSWIKFKEEILKSKYSDSDFINEFLKFYEKLQIREFEMAMQYQFSILKR